MTEPYQPELGQGVFGQPWQELAVPEYLEKALELMAGVLPNDEWGYNAFDNTAAQFECDVFKVHAYSWDEEPVQVWNFAWRDLRVSWYKYLGRGMSMNRAVTVQEVAEMVRECMDALAVE